MKKAVILAMILSTYNTFAGASFAQAAPKACTIRLAVGGSMVPNRSAYEAKADELQGIAEAYLADSDCTYTTDENAKYTIVLNYLWSWCGTGRTNADVANIAAFGVDQDIVATVYEKGAQKPLLHVDYEGRGNGLLHYRSGPGSFLIKTFKKNYAIFMEVIGAQEAAEAKQN